jgi:hypothetical protein
MSEQSAETQRSKLADGFATLTWKNEPGSWDDGGHGSWSLSENKQELEVVADSNRDYWQKTYYNPLLLSSFLVSSLSTGYNCSNCLLSFTFTPVLFIAPLCPISL